MPFRKNNLNHRKSPGGSSTLAHPGLSGVINILGGGRDGAKNLASIMAGLEEHLNSLPKKPSKKRRGVAQSG